MASELVALFRRITSGVYVIGVADGERRNAFTAAWVMHVSFQPLQVVLAIVPSHASYPLLVASGRFTVNVLTAGQLHLARHFGSESGRAADKLAGVAWHPAASGAPILDDALAWLDCRVERRGPGGDPELVIARVVDGALVLPDERPLFYSDTGELDGSSALYPDRF